MNAVRTEQTFFQTDKCFIVSTHKHIVRNILPSKKTQAGDETHLLLTGKE